MEMQSETIGKLAAALCKAQGMIQGARKDSKNPFFKSMYADLASVTEAVREPFGTCGLAYTQTFLQNDKGPVIVTTLMHESGEWQRSELFLPATKLDPQQFGSAITYGRRYSLAAIGGVIQEDDDGNDSSQHQQQNNQQQQSNATDKQWYNDFNSEKDQMQNAITSGKSTPDTIITFLEKTYKLSKKVKDDIKALTV